MELERRWHAETIVLRASLFKQLWRWSGRKGGKEVPMPDPVSSSISYRDVYAYDPDKDVGMRDSIVKNADQQTYGACARPQGLLAGVLCNDDTAVSDACRTAQPGTTAAYVCDDKNLQAVQNVVEQSTWDVLKNIIATALFGGVGK
jgi:hypothetical protein